LSIDLAGRHAILDTDMADNRRLSESQLQDALGLFGIEHSQVTLMVGGLAKTNYLVTATGGERFVLTVADDERNLPAETTARLLQHVAAFGMITSEPVESLGGNLLENVDHHCVLLKRYVDGHSHHVLPSAHLGPAGALLARIHRLPVPAWLPPGTRRMDDAAESVALFDDAEFAKWVLRNLADTRHIFDIAEPRVLNHGDYFADNLVVTTSGDIAVIDWDTASLELPLIDLGFAIVGLACIDTSLHADRLRELLDGYQSVRELDESTRALLKASAVYAATVLAHHRYRRFHVLHPDPRKARSHEEMQHVAESLHADWPS
jgi:homoserine kinase type II